MFGNVLLCTNISIIIILILLCIHFRRKYNKVNKDCINIRAQVLEVEEENINGFSNILKNTTYMPNVLSNDEDLLGRKINPQIYKTKVEYYIDNTVRIDTLLLPNNYENKEEIELLYDTKKDCIIKKKDIDKVKRSFWIMMFISVMIILAIFLSLTTYNRFNEISESINITVTGVEFNPSPVIQILLMIGISILAILVILIFNFMLLFIASIFVIVGLAVLYKPLRIFLNKNTYETQGQVIDFEIKGNTKTAIYTFYYNNKLVTRTSDLGASGKRNFQVGDTINILVNDKGASLIKKEIPTYLFVSILCIIVGVGAVYLFGISGG